MWPLPPPAPNKYQARAIIKDKLLLYPCIPIVSLSTFYLYLSYVFLSPFTPIFSILSLLRFLLFLFFRVGFFPFPVSVFVSSLSLFSYSFPLSPCVRIDFSSFPFFPPVFSIFPLYSDWFLFPPCILIGFYFPPVFPFSPCILIDFSLTQRRLRRTSSDFFIYS